MAGLSQLHENFRDGSPGASHLLLRLLCAVGVAVAELLQQLLRSGSDSRKLRRRHLNSMIQQDLVLRIHDKMVGTLCPDLPLGSFIMRLQEPARRHSRGDNGTVLQEGSDGP